MIGQFVEFKEYHINIQATYSLTEKIMHLNWLYSDYSWNKEDNYDFNSRTKNLNSTRVWNFANGTSLSFNSLVIA